MTGAEAAAAVARAGNASGIKIERHQGFLSDHYDPRSRTLRLSPDVYDGRSIASVAVAAHEAGHAIQHTVSYPALGFRSLWYPLRTSATRSGRCRSSSVWGWRAARISPARPRPGRC